MGKGDQRSKRGKITAGSYGKKRPRKSGSAKSIPVKVLDEEGKKSSVKKVREEVGYPTDKSENAEVEKKPKTAKGKAEKKVDDAPAKTKTTKAKKTEE